MGVVGRGVQVVHGVVGCVEKVMDRAATGSL